MSAYPVFPAMLASAVLLIASFWPGRFEVEPLEQPKKGYWTAATVFYPLRKAWRSLWPTDPVLLRSFRLSVLCAVFTSSGFYLASNSIPAVAGAVTPTWYYVDLVVTVFFLGRASGFWSAGHKLRAAKMAAAEAAEAKA